MQTLISEIIFRLLNIGENFDYNNYNTYSALSYGLDNYIAKYSLANNSYYISNSALTYVQQNLNNDLNNGGLLRRRKKNHTIKYDHAIPVNIVRRRLIELTDKTPENINRILAESNYVTILTTEENIRLNNRGLRQNMPNNTIWEPINPFARYIDIQLNEFGNIDNVQQITMRGAIVR